MADASKVRLVRCPKCENLLPELPGYSVYQCGGCGAVLRAKKCDPEESKVSERFDEAIVSEKSEDVPLESVSVEEAIRVRDSDVIVDQNKPERGESDGSSRIRRFGPEEDYHGEGTSRNFQRNRDIPDREELLRKLDELKEQLSKACDVNDKHKEKDPMEADHWLHDRQSGFRNRSRPLCASDQYHEPYGSYLRKAEMSMNHYLASGYENPYDSCPYARPRSHTHVFCSCRQCSHKCPQHPTQIPYRRHSLASSQGRFGHHNAIGGFSRPHRVVVTDSGRRCRPMAGGAPFVTCHNCFELLELPKKVPVLNKNCWKIRCGGCSSLISLDEKLVVVDPAPKQTLMEASDSSGEVLLDRPYDPHGGMRRDVVGFHSEEDYDNLGHELRSLEKEPSSNLVSSSTSEDEHFECSSKFRDVNRCGKGSLSSRSDQERVLPSKNVVRQNSLKDSMAMATELDISRHDYGNNEVLNDTSGEEDLPRVKRGVDSFLSGIIKKSFRDFKSSQAAENGKKGVFVNGRLVPDRSVKKAEKRAGPISPGQYWYDFTAGFWGVMGGPCLGIIPPHIEELNYPMPKNCAAGNTSVVVNGRELHENDLALLASRGLPLTRHRSYIVEMSGKVVDEDSGEELDSLGKLAPTIEKVKHGFGMRVPNSV